MTGQSARSFFLQAEALFDQGNFDEAIKYYKEALSLDPNMVEATINLSIALSQKGLPNDALIHIEEALKRHNTNVLLWNNYANLLRQEGRTGEAIGAYKRALEREPHAVAIRFNLAVLLHETNRLEEAIEAYTQLLQIDPYHKGALYNLSVILHQKGLYEDAISYLNRCLKIDPKDARTINLIALVFEAAGNASAAEGCFRRAIQLMPADYTVRFNYANLLSRQRRTEEAVEEYKKAVSLNLNSIEAYIQLGNHLKLLKRYTEAIDAYHKVIELDPSSADGYNNLGNVLKEMGRYDEALSYINRAIEIDPKQAGYYFNLGLIYKELYRYEDAIDAYRSAISLKYDYPEAHWNLALLLLMHGDFKNGWPQYEWRKRLSLYEPYVRGFKEPLWRGEDLQGKRILIHDEQGFGDAIQFVRYVPLLKAMGATVFVECLSPLARLFEGVVGVDRVITRGFGLPNFDYHCSILSLPMMFKTDLTNLPNKVPYIKVDEALLNKWSQWVGEYGKNPKIGIAWSGINPPHKSCRIEDLLALLKISGRCFFNLQYGPAQKELTILPMEIMMIDLMDRVEDFADTAALIMNLDLVITIDTSIAHLAGALGKPVWVLLHYDADWRWLLGRSDSPWYPTMRLFRQAKPGDWQPVVESVAARL